MKSLPCWVNGSQNSQYPIQNLPIGIFSTAHTPGRVGIAIGDFVLDLERMCHLFPSQEWKMSKGVFQRNYLNAFLTMGKQLHKTFRSELQTLLSEKTELYQLWQKTPEILIPMNQVKMHLPSEISNYVDFYSSEEHATNVGKMVRDPNNPLLPNWKHIPIGYNGRSSSIVVSQTTFHRPWGQIKLADSDVPVFSPSRNMDFELEVGFITCKENKLGEPVSTVEADNYIYGLCLLNDLSARDIQTWEYQPLGPFLGKSFCTSISPWIVSMEALEPFRCASPTPTVPQLPYLCGAENRNLDIELFAYLKPKNSAEEYLICSTNFKHMYWSMNQQVAHLTSNGTNIKVGDLYGSGTVSGKTPTSFGSMLELCWKGTRPLTLPNGETRVFLQDHDEIILRGHCEKDGIKIGFGEVRNVMLPAIEKHI
jgi:fumarylacetoacetase